MKEIIVGYLEWDDDNRDHIWKRHRLIPRDVHDVLEDPGKKTRLIATSKYGERLVVMGRDRGGRPLMVFLAPIEKGEGKWRCATAREADSHERKRYF